VTQAQEPKGWREDHARQRDQGIRKRTFTVVGTTKVAGKSQGETVELEFTEAAIDALIQAGCIQEQGFGLRGEDGPEVISVKVSDDASNTDVAGTPPVDKRATSAQSTKKG
jgi:hypothetical protein